MHAAAIKHFEYVSCFWLLSHYSCLLLVFSTTAWHDALILKPAILLVHERLTILGLQCHTLLADHSVTVLTPSNHGMRMHWRLFSTRLTLGLLSAIVLSAAVVSWAAVLVEHNQAVAPPPHRWLVFHCTWVETPPMQCKLRDRVRKVIIKKKKSTCTGLYTLDCTGVCYI